MRIVGEWLLCTDGETRPVVKAFVTDVAGAEVEAYFLIDTGADRTVFTADLLALLGLPSSAPPPGFALAGVGSRPAFVVVPTPSPCTRTIDRPPASGETLRRSLTRPPPT
jgi:hypothetical protein